MKRSFFGPAFAMIICLTGFGIACGDNSPAADVIQNDAHDAGVDYDTRDTAATDSEQDINATQFLVGPEGGSHDFPGGIRVTVPRDALDEELEITMSLYQWVGPEDPATSLGESIAPVSEFWEFGPSGLTFSEPITVAIPYAEQDAAGKEIDGFWSVAQTEEPPTFDAVPDTTAADGILSMQVDHFSLGFVGFIVEETPWVPDGMTFNAEEGQPVEPGFIPTLKSDVALIPDTFEFELKSNGVDVEGMPIFAQDNLSFYFFPDHLLPTSTSYTMSFRNDGIDWTLDFETTDDAGEMPMTGNADVTGENAYSFKWGLESVLEPAPKAELMMEIYDLCYTDTWLISPLFMDSDDNGTAEFMFAATDSMDFDGDGNFETNHTSRGVRLSGEYHGNYFLHNGPVTFTRLPGGDVEQAVSMTIDKVYASGKVTLSGDEKPSISSGVIMIHSEDCSSPLEFFRDEEVHDAIGFICDESTDTLFSYVSFSATNNELTKRTFEIETAAPGGIEVAFTPGLDAKYSHLRDCYVLVELYKDDELVRSSTDFPGSISVPNEWIDHEDLWKTFNKIRFTLPEESELDPGSYRMRLVVGLDAWESDFQIN